MELRTRGHRGCFGFGEGCQPGKRRNFRSSADRPADVIITLPPQALLDLHKVAERSNDPQMTDFIEGEFLKEQVEAIKEFGDLLTRIRRAGDGLGLHVIDKELLDGRS